MSDQSIGFYYNQVLCSGCKTCQVACKDKNRLSVGTILREVRTYQIGEYPDVKMYHYSATCNHCDEPVCFENCPVGAIEKYDDGAVVIDDTMCIGCGTCVRTCPYSVPKLEEETGLARKCDSCYALRERGYQPACVEACPYRALDFGTVAELKQKYGSDLVTELPALEMQEGAATGPNVLVKLKGVAKEELGMRITL